MQVGATHTAHSYTQSSSNPSFADGENASTTLLRFENPPITQYDASAGVSKDAWSVDLYADNLTNVIKSTFTSTNQFVLAETISASTRAHYRRGADAIARANTAR